MATTNQVKIFCGYEDTDFSRAYTFDCAASVTADVKVKIKAINASLEAGTDDGMSSFFVGDDGQQLASITSAFIITDETSDIDISEDDSDSSDA